MSCGIYLVLSVMEFGIPLKITNLSQVKSKIRCLFLVFFFPTFCLHLAQTAADLCQTLARMMF